MARRLFDRPLGTINASKQRGGWGIPLPTVVPWAHSSWWMGSRRHREEGGRRAWGQVFGMRGRCLGGEVGRACVEGWLGVLGSLGLLVPESGLPLCGAGCRWLPTFAVADRSRGNGR
jgi:hypothetical protein